MANGHRDGSATSCMGQTPLNPTNTAPLRLASSLVRKWRFSSFQEWANAMARRPSSVCLSVCPSVCKLLRKSLLLADKWPEHYQLSQNGLQVSMHPGCAQGQGQGQRSRNTRTFLDSWNELLRHWRSGMVFALLPPPGRTVIMPVCWFVPSLRSIRVLKKYKFGTEFQYLR